MKTPSAVHPTATVQRARIFMVIAWVAILAKCMFVTWAVDHWQMPFHAAWVVAPTLTFAALATLLWLAHHEE